MLALADAHSQKAMMAPITRRIAMMIKMIPTIFAYSFKKSSNFLRHVVVAYSVRRHSCKTGM